jgi:hypothetical protein
MSKNLAHPLSCRLCGEHADVPPGHERFRHPLCAAHERYRDEIGEYLEARLEQVERDHAEQRSQWEQWRYHWGGDEGVGEGVCAQEIWSSWPS